VGHAGARTGWPLRCHEQGQRGPRAAIVNTIRVGRPTTKPQPFGIRSSVTIAIAGLVCATTLAAQSPTRRATSTVQGRVSDTTGLPIAVARVSTSNGASGLTDSLGRYHLVNVLPGDGLLLDVARIGFLPAHWRVSLVGDTTYNLDIVLAPVPITLGAITVTGHDSGLEEKGFYERMGHWAWATFITPEQVERARPVYISQLLQTVPGVRIAFESASAIPYTRSGCRMAVWLNGQRADEVYGTAVGDGGRSHDLGIDALIQAREVKAIEVYANNDIVPVEFIGPSNPLRPTCGALVIWTKP
jgi:hypothetical protein